MKKNIIFLALGMGLLSFVSCSKTEVRENSATDLVSGARKGGQPAVTSYGGFATALNATITTIQNGMVISNQTLVANTGMLAPEGGSLSATEAQANIQGIVTAENLNASISGGANQTVAYSSLTALSLSTNGHVITAGSVNATATSACAGTSGSSTVTGLVVNGTPITITGSPNQLVFLQGGGFVMINEQSTSKKGRVTSINVTALRIVIPNAADVRVAEIKAEIKCN